MRDEALSSDPLTENLGAEDYSRTKTYTRAFISIESMQIFCGGVNGGSE